MQVGKYKIESEPLNITVYDSYTAEKDTKTHSKGDIVYKPIAYFMTVKQALKWIVKREVSETGLKDLETVVDKIDGLERKIDNLDLEEVKEEIHNPSMEEMEEFFKGEAMD